jgi:hypothetical protein
MPKAFISYSHRDEKALDRLHTHLATLRRAGEITDWFDREILAGGNLDSEIGSNLSDSEFFFALISPDFLASNYCYEREMKTALKRHEEGSLRVIPIILEPCDWKSTPLAQLKALPKDGKPISTWTNENVAYLDIVTELRRLLSASDKNDRSTKRNESEITKPSQGTSKRYRVRKEFDSIDRDDFREKAFRAIEEFFRVSVDELNEIGDPIRARFEKMNETAFSCTVLNKAARNSEAHITVHGDSSRSFGGDISYSFSRRSPGNTANGFIRVASNEYELYLKLDSLSFIGDDKESPSSTEQVAESLWHEFISHAGIDHE